ncbi:MAG: hypothetical protein AAF383_10470 [Cyanobacteria bacterium P01_A01_bin.83]
MLKDTLKQEIDNLNEEQLKQIADLIISLKVQDKNRSNLKPFWQKATPEERSQDFREWVTQLPHSNISLSDKVFDRISIYD